MIYRITHNIDHVQQFDDFDAELVPFEKSGGITYEIPDFPYERYAPAVMTFRGDLSRLSLSDFPHTRPTLPMMSMKMLLACLSAGEFPYAAHPTAVYPRDLTNVQQGQTEPSMANSKFFNIHLTTWTNVLDADHTLIAKRDLNQPRAARIYTVVPASRSDDPGYLDLEAIERLELTVPEEELPGLFRMPQLYGLFGAEKTKLACEQAGVTGVLFTPVPVPLGQGVRPYLNGFRLVSELPEFDNGGD
ncbi:hypothetical protein [Deinococcus sp. UYEF24]